VCAVLRGVKIKMKTLNEYLSDSKTSPLLYSELSHILKRSPNHESDYLFFYVGRLLSSDIRSNSFKWKNYYIELGYTVAGEYLILRRAAPVSGYEHSKYAGVIFLRKE